MVRFDPSGQARVAASVIDDTARDDQRIVPPRRYVLSPFRFYKDILLGAHASAIERERFDSVENVGRLSRSDEVPSGGMKHARGTSEVEQVAPIEQKERNALQPRSHGLWHLLVEDAAAGGSGRGKCHRLAGKSIHFTATVIVRAEASWPLARATAMSMSTRALAIATEKQWCCAANSLSDWR